MVIDPRETWKQWIRRTATFEEPPMIERKDLPDENQPHKKIFSKVENYLNGINPYPPGHKWNKKSNKIAIAERNNLVIPASNQENTIREERKSANNYNSSDSEEFDDFDGKENRHNKFETKTHEDMVQIDLTNTPAIAKN